MSAWDLVLGASAACLAVSFTNPLDVLKVKFQLQSETLQHSNAVAARRFSVAGTISGLYRKEGGIRGLQKGLAAAYLYQATMNGARFFVYERCKGLFSAQRRPNYLSLMASGAISGSLGAAIASPFNLVKTRMQSFSTESALRTGDQHAQFTSVGRSLSLLYGAGGWRAFFGLWTGVRASVLRTGLGSCFQLATYDAISSRLQALSRTCNVLLSSLGAGLMGSLAVCPLDVITTRLYNQAHKGKYYGGIVDCAIKTIQREGLLTLYRGFLPLFLRMGPHSLLTFYFLERLRAVFHPRYRNS